ncbi:MAG: gliding motility-associated C-terminal domain-containing protein [Catalinimonas sp.]
MRFFLLAGLLLFGAVGARATHIVGGEITVEHEVDNDYRVSLNLYFDDVNGNPDALDAVVTLTAFSKSTNGQVERFSLFEVASTPVEYTDPNCVREGSDRVETTLYRYSEVFTLDPLQYTDPAGYYLIWERCCRNNVITNIIAPQDAGQTFYMEMPPLIRDGATFRNSSPNLFAPLSDYACVGDPFFFDFSGTDQDGDSLAYSLAVPLQGNSGPVDGLIIPPPTPGPYAPVRWLTGFSNAVQIAGPDPLGINPLTGFVTLTAGQSGLHVFAVKCEEFRDGVKIGEVRREFQLLVVECERNDPPDAQLVNPNTGELYVAGDTIRLKPGGPRCLPLIGADFDQEQVLSGRAVAINFPDYPGAVLVTGQGPVNSAENPSDTILMQLCFDSCLASLDVPLEIDLIVQDNGCSRPKTDTIRLVIEVPPVGNEAPTATVASLVENDTLSIFSGQQTQFDVLGFDPDDRPVVTRAYGTGLQLPFYDMRFASSPFGDSLRGTFSWLPPCRPDILGFYQVNFVVTDESCLQPLSDTVIVWLEVLPEPNEAPTVRKLLDGDTVVLEVDQGLAFRVEGTDPDERFIRLRAEGDGFALSDYNMRFNESTATRSVESIFFWTPTCADFNAQGDGYFVVNFVGNDDHCQRPLQDTTRVWLRVETADLPATLSTDLEVLSLGDVPVPRVEMLAGRDTTFQLFADDLDTTDLRLDAYGVGFDLADAGMSFQNRQGRISLVSPFTWAPECGMLAANPYRVVFRLTENACPGRRVDSLVLDLHIIDSLERPIVDPPNVFSPNGDDRNDVFILPTLPPDNCQDRFVSVRVYNRWGQEVYATQSRDFLWDGGASPSGTYYYVVEYERKNYKGWVQLMR